MRTIEFNDGWVNVPMEKKNTSLQIWQVVYRTPSKVGMVYLKLTVISDVLSVSFKEL